ncbi:carboxypeptidase regulatory-like domain-containing protein [Goodfellowiella coeruleoviolacea]|uniref:Uncharacterized protein n=1 Tax=Goodfellowiella coeruleoviolacea TaxID=334858 RepID=A0AAE3KEG3_9PSEU|nr:carboxypeptidase regulatory-like domain-containing protein [Goodfellowiella coeruleoviolacea]MCP2163339.1 hypothetical protein [Goodfellowiella coeruleoviolacea]
MSRMLPVARLVGYSPAWFVPFDDFARKVRTAGVSVALDRWVNGRWEPQDTPVVRTPSAALAYPGLGRRGGVPPDQVDRYRARFAAAGYRPLYPADDQPFTADLVGVEFSVRPHRPDQPPTEEVEARLVRLLPSVSFAYPPGVRTVHGVVRDPVANAPVRNALVEVRGQQHRDLVSWRERTLSDDTGAFRLALRWEGEKASEDAVEETFHLHATERPGRTGSLVIQLPRDADAAHVIEIREQ